MTTTTTTCPSPGRDVLRPAEAAVALNVSPATLYRILAAGELESFRDGKERWITASSVATLRARRAAEKDE